MNVLMSLALNKVVYYKSAMVYALDIHVKQFQLSELKPMD